jgi:hypothetical protein
LLFGPRRCSFLLALALAARAIVVLIGGLFNRLGFDVVVCPLVELKPVEGDPLLSDWEFPNVWPDRFVEFVPAHAEIAVRVPRANEAREDGRDLCRASICHWLLLRAALGGRRLMNGHAVLADGNLACLLFCAEGNVLLDAAAVGYDPPESAKAVWAFDDLRDGHGILHAARGGRRW